MTPKKEAKALVMRFRKFGLSWDECKQCALICVGEIIKDYQQSMRILPMYNHFYAGGLLHWQEVKTEIEKL